ncbi:MAG: TonB-dependent receptor [Saprospiraceae bacterium]
MSRLIFLLILLPSLSIAQSTLLIDTSQLEVVVTAQRQEVQAFKLAEAVSVLSQDAIMLQGSRSAPEALFGLSGVWVQKTNHGGGSPFLRGMTGNQTLLLLDGIRLNNSTYRYGPNQYFNTIDVLGIQQVEVVRGGGSVLYGSDALGGTINVLTHSPSFASEKEQIRVGLLSRAMSHGMEWGLRPEVEYAEKNLAILATFSMRDFGDLLAGGDLGKLIASSYQEQTAALKGKLKLGSQSLLTLAYNGVFQSEVGRYDQVAQRGYALHQFDPQNREMAYAKWEMPGEKALFKKMTLTASWQHSKEGRDKQKEDSPVLQRELDEVRTVGASAEIQSTIGKSWQVVSGLEWYYDLINSVAYDEDQAKGQTIVQRGLYPDGASAHNWAVYSSWTFSQSRWRLNGGLRFNGFQLETSDEVFTNVSLSPTALVGNLSVRYALSTHHALVGGLYSAFRAPNINDLSSFGSFDFGIEVPSGALDPERSLNMEIGHKFQNPSFQSNLSIYHIRLYDLIDRIRGTYLGQSQWEGQDVYLKANVASAYVQGMELDGTWLLAPGLKVNSNLTYTYGQNESANEPMRRIPPLNGLLAMHFQANRAFSASFQALFAGKQTRLSAGDLDDHRIANTGTPAWSVFNLHLGYQYKWLHLHGGIQNLLNEAYRIHGSGVDGIGRSFWLSLKLK